MERKVFTRDELIEKARELDKEFAVTIDRMTLVTYMASYNGWVTMEDLALINSLVGDVIAW